MRFVRITDSGYWQGEMATGNNNGVMPLKRRLMPFLAWTPLVNANSLQADFWAALTGALVVLPQGIAYATIAGMPPVYGLYAGMIPAIVGALFGSSWQLVSGPTVAGSLVMFSALSAMAEPASAQYVVLGLTLAFLVGVLELGMGVLKLGALVNFISHSVIVGFTAGAGVLIAANQLKTSSGLTRCRAASSSSRSCNMWARIWAMRPG